MGDSKITSADDSDTAPSNPLFLPHTVPNPESGRPSAFTTVKHRAWGPESEKDRKWGPDTDKASPAPRDEDLEPKPAFPFLTGDFSFFNPPQAWYPGISPYHLPSFASLCKYIQNKTYLIFVNMLMDAGGLNY